MKFLQRFGSLLLRNDPLSEVVQGLGNATLPGRCGACSDSFRYPMNLVFLPWQPKASTIDVGGFCKHCGHAVCQRHVKTMKLSIEGKTGWILTCTTCGGPLLGVKDAIAQGGLGPS